MTLSREKLALIHIVKKELGLSDEDYRQILKDVTGEVSSKFINDRGFRKLMNFMVRDHRYRIFPGGMTLRQKLYIQNLSRRLEWSRQHLINFVSKYYHKPDLESLTQIDASKLITSLKHIIQKPPRPK